MEEIKNTVKRVLEEINSKRKIPNYKKINLLLKKVLNPKETRYIHIHSLRKDVLRIDTYSTVLLYQLNIKKNLILKRIQEDFGPDFIKRIVFRLVPTISE